MSFLRSFQKCQKVVVQLVVPTVKRKKRKMCHFVIYQKVKHQSRKDDGMTGYERSEEKTGRPGHMKRFRKHASVGSISFQVQT